MWEGRLVEGARVGGGGELKAISKQPLTCHTEVRLCTKDFAMIRTRWQLGQIQIPIPELTTCARRGTYPSGLLMCFLHEV